MKHHTLKVDLGQSCPHPFTALLTTQAPNGRRPATVQVMIGEPLAAASPTAPYHRAVYHLLLTESDARALGEALLEQATRLHDQGEVFRLGPALSGVEGGAAC